MNASKSWAGAKQCSSSRLAPASDAASESVRRPQHQPTWAKADRRNFPPATWDGRAVTASPPSVCAILGLIRLTRYLGGRANGAASAWPASPRVRRSCNEHGRREGAAVLHETDVVIVGAGLVGGVVA